MCSVVTKLDKPIKREIQIRGNSFIVTFTPDGFKLVGKGRRKGLEMSWDALTSGEAALATALTASLDPKLRLEPAELKQLRKASRRGTPVARLSLVKGGHSHGGRSKANRTARRRAH
jgi:hypothetical protein